MVDKKKDFELKKNGASGTDSSSKIVKSNKSRQILKNDSSSSNENKPDHVDGAKMSGKKIIFYETIRVFNLSTLVKNSVFECHFVT